MKDAEPIYLNILTIYKDDYVFEYDRDTKNLFLSWLDEDDEETSLLIYDDSWHLEESPIKDMSLLELYLKTFKEFK